MDTEYETYLAPCSTAGDVTFSLRPRCAYCSRPSVETVAVYDHGWCMPARLEPRCAEHLPVSVPVPVPIPAYESTTDDAHLDRIESRLFAIEVRLATVERQLARMLPNRPTGMVCAGCLQVFAEDEVSQPFRDAIGATRFYHTDCLPPEAETED